MREMFKGFYSEEADIKDVLKRDDVRIVFDTNVLSELYKYDEETRENFFNYLEKYRDKIWIPYHVALEFQMNRVRMINEAKEELEKLKQDLKNYRSKFEAVRSAPIWKTTKELKEKVSEFENTFDSFIEEASGQLKVLIKNQNEALKKDPIRDRLDDLLKGNIGEKPTEQQVKDLHDDGKKRFSCSIPPGNCDQGKDKSKFPHMTCANRTYERKYGDLIVWKQTIEMAKDGYVNAVVFVTDDSKPDWWMHEDKKGTGRLIERPELREEILTNAALEHFYMVDSEHFFSEAFGALSYSYEKSIELKKKKVSTDQLGLFGGGASAEYSPKVTIEGYLVSFMPTSVGRYWTKQLDIDFLFNLDEIKTVMDAKFKGDERFIFSKMVRETLMTRTGEFTVQDLVKYIYDTLGEDMHKDLGGAAAYLLS